MMFVRNLLLFALFAFGTVPAHAYIGPGGGLSAIGALLALVAVLGVTFFAFLWYPIKRMRRRRAERKQAAANPPSQSTPPRP